MTLILILSYVFVALALYFIVEAWLGAESCLERITWLVVICGILLSYYIYLSEVL